MAGSISIRIYISTYLGIPVDLILGLRHNSERILEKCRLAVFPDNVLEQIISTIAIFSLMNDSFADRTDVMANSHSRVGLPIE